MSVESFAKEDFPEYEAILKKRFRPLIPFSFLPPTGVKICFEGKMVAAGFLAKTDTPFACICDLATDPDAPHSDRDIALLMLIQELERLAKEFGYTAVCASTNHRGLEDRYVKMGYLESDKGLALYTRVLCQQAD